MVKQKKGLQPLLRCQISCWPDLEVLTVHLSLLFAKAKLCRSDPQHLPEFAWRTGFAPYLWKPRDNRLQFQTSRLDINTLMFPFCVVIQSSDVSYFCFFRFATALQYTEAEEGVQHLLSQKWMNPNTFEVTSPCGRGCLHPEKCQVTIFNRSQYLFPLKSQVIGHTPHTTNPNARPGLIPLTHTSSSTLMEKQHGPSNNDFVFLIF